MCDGLKCEFKVVVSFKCISREDQLLATCASPDCSNRLIIEVELNRSGHGYRTTSNMLDKPLQTCNYNSVLYVMTHYIKYQGQGRSCIMVDTCMAVMPKV